MAQIIERYHDIRDNANKTFVNIIFRNFGMNGQYNTWLKNYKFNDCTFENIDFSGCNLSGMDLSNCKGLQTCNFEDAIVDKHTKFPGMFGSAWDELDGKLHKSPYWKLSGKEFYVSGSTISYSDEYDQDMIIKDLRFKNFEEFDKAIRAGYKTFKNCTFQYVEFLTSPWLKDLVFDGCSFPGAALNGTLFENVTFKGCNMGTVSVHNGAKLKNCKFEGNNHLSRALANLNMNTQKVEEAKPAPTLKAKLVARHPTRAELENYKKEVDEMVAKALAELDASVSLDNPPQNIVNSNSTPTTSPKTTTGAKTNMSNGDKNPNGIVETLKDDAYVATQVVTGRKLTKGTMAGLDKLVQTFADNEEDANAALRVLKNLFKDKRAQAVVSVMLGSVGPHVAPKIPFVKNNLEYSNGVFQKMRQEGLADTMETTLDGLMSYAKDLLPLLKALAGQESSESSVDVGAEKVRALDAAFEALEQEEASGVHERQASGTRRS